MARTRAYRLALTVGAGLVGLLLQALDISALRPIWPGRVPTLAVAILLGPWYGTGATLIAIGPTAPRLALMGICVAEVLIIGFFARKHRSPLLAGANFWVANGLLFAIDPVALRRRLSRLGDLALRPADDHQRTGVAGAGRSPGHDAVTATAPVRGRAAAATAAHLHLPRVHTGRGAARPDPQLRRRTDDCRPRRERRSRSTAASRRFHGGDDRVVSHRVPPRRRRHRQRNADRHRAGPAAAAGAQRHALAVEHRPDHRRRSRRTPARHRCFRSDHAGAEAG